MSPKLLFRFYGHHEVRAVWNEAGKQWWFAVAKTDGRNEEDGAPPKIATLVL